MGNNVEDEAWCDVVPIDACHILLGRPWLYDKDMIHHTRANTYAFKKGTKTSTLRPLKEEATSSSKMSKLTGFLIGQRFETESKELGVIYALIGRMMIAEQQVDFAEYPLEAQQILREFQELVGEELHMVCHQCGASSMLLIYCLVQLHQICQHIESHQHIALKCKGKSRS